MYAGKSLLPLALRSGLKTLADDILVELVSSNLLILDCNEST